MPGRADDPETTVGNAPSADTEIVESADSEPLYAWELDDGHDWPRAPWWTPGRVTAAAVVCAVLALVVAAGIAGYHLRGAPERDPVLMPMPTTTSPIATTTAPSIETTAPPPPTERPNPLPARVNLPSRAGTAYVRTRSGKTVCQVTAGVIECNVAFVGRTPTRNGLRAIGVAVRAEGGWDWLFGDPGDPDYVTMSYGTVYRALGWTIAPASDGTTFTNEATGHGMTVSVEGVRTF